MIQSSLSDVNTRIATLENNARITSSTTAPVASTSDQFFSAHERDQQHHQATLAGKNINFIKILLGSELCDRGVVDCGDISIALKDADP